MDKSIYLDHAATTPMSKGAIDVLNNCLSFSVANPSSPHLMGQRSLKRIETAKNEMLTQLNAGAQYDLLFTSSATEANNQVVFHFNHVKGIFASSANHPSLVRPIEQITESSGFNFVEVQSILSKKLWQNSLSALILEHQPAVIFLSWVNNLCGIVLPIVEIAQFVKDMDPSIHIHVDGSQGFCKLNLSLAGANIDSLSLSGHKMGGPQGIGALVFRKAMIVKPLLFGGGQQAGLRSSTLPQGLICSFAFAANETNKKNESDYVHVQALLHYLQEELINFYQVSMPFINSELEVSPYIVAILVPPVPSDMIVRHLEGSNIFISSSSACSSKRKGTQPELLALGIAEPLHKYFLRVSLSPNSSLKEMKYFVSEFKKYYLELSELFVGKITPKTR